MLELVVPATESYDEVTQQFINSSETHLRLEHSLVALSKWESEWEKPFIGKDVKTDEQTMSYIRCMALDPDIPPEVFHNLSPENYKAINQYIEAKMTATWFTDKPTREGSRETITSELIYYWMIALNIPMECENWHLGRLFTLIKVCNQKNSPPKKMTKQELRERNRRLNAERKAQLNTTG